MSSRQRDQDDDQIDFGFPLEDDLMVSLQTRTELQIPDELVDEINSAQWPVASLSGGEGVSDLHGLLKADQGFRIPNAVGERALVGILNIYRTQDPSYKRQVFNFPLRHLVETYVYPDRQFRASSKEMQIVLEALRSIAHTRLITDAWHDHQSRRRVQMDASLIDYVRVVYEGDNNTPQTIEVAWGLQMWRSLQGRYTKGLNRDLFISIRRPIDLRLFRWVDSQLSRKREQKVKSIRAFGMFRLGMKNKKLNKPGRTASSYVARQLEASIQRLNDLGFGVRLIIDRSPADFRLTFQRLDHGPHQVENMDEVRDLLLFFAAEVHKAESSRTRFQQSDRDLAQAWLEQYGVEASQWMAVKSAEWFVRAQKEKGKQGVNAKPRQFRALAPYEDAAKGAWDSLQAERAGQNLLPLQSDEQQQAMVPRYEDYFEIIVRRAQEREPGVDQDLITSVRTGLEKDAAWRSAGEHMRQKWLHGALKEARQLAYSIMSREVYEEKTLVELDQELMARHGLTSEKLSEAIMSHSG